MASQWALNAHAPAWLRLAGFQLFADVLAMGIPTAHPSVRMPKVILHSIAASLD